MSLPQSAKLFTPQLAEQFIKWSVVGTIGAVVDFSLLYALHHLMGVNVYIANTVSFTVAVINNFLLNRYWTFRGMRHKEASKQLPQFYLVSVGGYILNQMLLAFFIELVGLAWYWSKALATIVVLVWNFVVNRQWTFREIS